MTTSYTSGLRLTNQPDGGNANTWGDIADNNFEFIDDAITGRVSVNMTGASSYTLTVGNGSDDEARNANIFIHGIPTSANSVIIPAGEKYYGVKAEHTSVSGGITVRTNTGTGVNFLTGETKILYCDGVSVEVYGEPFEETCALDPSDNLSDLADVSVARDNLGLQPQGPYLFTSGSKLEANLSAFTSNLFEAVWPVGSLYQNRTDGTNPNTLFGFGTWVSAGMGRVPIGVGTGVDESGVSVTISAETCGGEYEHALTTAEIPSMGVNFESNFRLSGRSHGVGPDNTYMSNAGSTQTASVGGSGNSFEINQPWYSVYQWVRTA